jgi:hypothetical protein
LRAYGCRHEGVPSSEVYDLSETCTLVAALACNREETHGPAGKVLYTPL